MMALATPKKVALRALGLAVAYVVVALPSVAAAQDAFGGAQPEERPSSKA